MKFTRVILLLFYFSVGNLVSGVLAQEIRPRSELDKDLKIWFTHPAPNWENALPVGNGRLGAMIFGEVNRERIQLNEETVWTGEKRDYYNPESLEGLAETRKLLFEGKYPEAEYLAQHKIFGDKPRNERHTYQTLGDLNLDFGVEGQVSDYRRELDIDSAIAKVSYSNRGTHFRRTIFSSAPGQAIVIRLEADKDSSVNFSASLSRPGNKALIQVRGNEIIMSEHVGNGIGVKMVARLKILNEGGEISSTGNGLKIVSADAATLFITASTDYRGNDPSDESAMHMASATSKPYDLIRQEHIRDYQYFFKRLDFNLGTTDAVYFPTDARMLAVKNGNYDPQLLTLYYQFGRYLLISSSRPGCLPANLQGIWADGLTPPWSADYHININIQMNYWLSETTNLSELHMPFLEFIDDLREDARRTAGDVYGCKGIVAHYTTDVWHFTEPTGATRYGMWPMGMNWSCQHLWEHYAFTNDLEYLEKMAYPIMKEAALFSLDWLVKDPQTGFLVSGPSISPENRFVTPDGKTASVCMGPAMDQMIIWDLLDNTIKASEILGVDKTFRAQMQETMDNLAPMKTGSDGRIMEWADELQEAEPGHRHISHLFGLHPGKQISMQNNPEFMVAARKTIDYRLSHGGGHTGWSRAWIINFFARLQDGDKAFENLVALLRNSTLDNLFDTHPPFQIDGNFGAAAGITEMLLQSHTGEIHLLPALPAVWDQGYIHGICARGGFEVDIDWKEGNLFRAVLTSKSGNICKIRYKDKVTELKTEAGKSYILDSKLVIKEL